MLGPRDRLSLTPRRILVAGLSGSGKTTLARRLAHIRDLPYVELDALHHGPGWQPSPSFVDEVDALAARDAWVTEWQYGSARPLLAARSDLLIWLDPPLAVSMTRLIRRTLRRRIRRQVLWNGNLEPPLRTILTDPEHVVRYAWIHRRKYRRRLIPDLVAARPELTIVHLRSQADVERWVAGLPRLDD